MQKCDAILLSGKHEPTRFASARATWYSGIADALAFAKSQGWKKVGKGYSGVYYELRHDEWWETSDFDACDREHGLPSNGRKL